VATYLDRMLARSEPPPVYSEQSYTGAQYAPGFDSGGKPGREAIPPGLVRLAREAYRANGIVFAVEAVKTALFAEARFKFQAMTDDHIFGDPSLSILEHPWPGADAGELLARMCQDGGLGSSYIRKAIPAGDGDPVLVRMPPDRVTIASLELEDDLGRTWRQVAGYIEDMGPGREPQVYSTDEVGHFSPHPDPSANWRGMSWLTPILKDVHADTRLTEYKTFHIDNGAQPGLVVKYSTKLSPTTVDTLRKRFRARWGGPQNAGNILVLDEGADLSVSGSTLEQLQFDAVTRAGERRVCAAAGPGLLVICGFEQGDYQTAIRELADLWARPWWRMACAALEHLVPTSAGIGPVRLWYDVSGIAALREGELNRAQAFLVNVQGIASAVAAGYKRETAVAASASGDVSLLEADPKAPPPGGTAKAAPGGEGGQPQPATGGPEGNGQISGRPPQAGRPQQLPGTGKPNVPNARPGRFGPMPAAPAGARGQSNGNGSRH
jgi:hypothetical protein